MRILTWLGLIFLALPLLAADQVEEQVRDRMLQRLGRQSRVLSLEDCIKIALEHNLDIQIKQLEPEMARFSLSGSYGSYDPALSLSGKHSYTLSPGGLDSNGLQYNGIESETDSFSIGIGGSLPWGMGYNLSGSLSDRTGTQPTTLSDLSNPLTVTTSQYFDIALNTNVTVLRTNYGTVPGRFAFENSSANVGVFSLRQPLLKDFWIDSARLQIFLNKNNLKISELDLRWQIIDTVTKVEEAYLNLIYSEELVKVQEKALELAERSVAENRRRVEVGAMAPLDEKQAESQAAASRANLLDAQSQLGTQQRVLKSLLSDNYEEWKGAGIHPTESLQAVPQQMNLQESWRKGTSTHPKLLQARLGVLNQERVVKYQNNQRLPSLDLVGNAGYSGSDEEIPSAFKQVRRADNPFYSYGVELSIPLGNVRARNDYRKEKATKEQLELQLKQVEQGILIDIENSIATARTSLERVDATKQARLYAEDALKAEETKLEKGKSTSYFVLDLQSKLTAARSAEIRALADYNIALARLAQSEGSTLDRRNIDLKVK